MHSPLLQGLPRLRLLFCTCCPLTFLISWWPPFAAFTCLLLRSVIAARSHPRRLCGLQSPNILFTKDWEAKIGDAGLARLLSKSHLSHCLPVGTFAWTAPELLWGLPVGFSAGLPPAWHTALCDSELASSWSPVRCITNRTVREAAVPLHALTGNNQRQGT